MQALVERGVVEEGRRGCGEVEAGLTKRKKCRRRSCGVIEGRGVGARRQEQEMSSSDGASETEMVVVGRQQQTAADSRTARTAGEPPG